MANTTIRTLRADEIECRIGTLPKNGKGLSLLLYKDARCDMAILDEVFGPMNWMRQHSRDNANCTVSIWDSEKQQWISKEDTGVDSNTEAEKGRASDSFKRACFNWGIGRELYTAPFIWIPNDKCNIEKDERGFLNCKDKFKVSAIEYNNNHEITVLEIINDKTKDVVYYFNQKSKTPKKNPKVQNTELTDDDLKPDPNYKAPPEEPVFRCRDCGNALVWQTAKDGSIINPTELRDLSYKRYGRVLCADCMKKEEERKKAEKESA